MIHLAIFASGSGTNAEKIMEFFEFDEEITVSVVFSNKTDAFVLKRAENFGVPFKLFDRQEFADPQFSRRLDAHQVDYLVLAGFLWKVPEHLLKAFPNKIINIHPALLPKYGGKGMYGDRVHEAVLENGDRKSGITIHLVNENYDEGRILFQAECEVLINDTVDELASRIHQLEHRHFPRVIKEYIHRCFSH
ncbi:MAG: phosphoribosylglycinamide formyltransferase [Cytophagales bacterium]|nr:phosphoribosylglycinamide formyltransferase [Cytophagales bacterium]